MPSSLRKRGFTLIELLVAVAVLAIVAVLGWRGLDGIVRSRQALTEQMEQTRGIQLAFAQLQSDLDHLALRKQLRLRENMSADTARFALVRTVLEEGEPTRLQVVSYRIGDGVLTRRESLSTRDLLRLDILWQAALNNTDDSPGVVLQSGVDTMTARIWRDGGWQPMPAGGQGAQNAQDLPGMELSLQMRGQSAPLIKVFMLGEKN